MPIYFLKFEELVKNPEELLQEVFKFLLDTEDISGTVIERRIKEIVDLGASATQAYKVKGVAPKYKKSSDMFTEKQY